MIVRRHQSKTKTIIIMSHCGVIKLHTGLAVWGFYCQCLMMQYESNLQAYTMNEIETLINNCITLTVYQHDQELWLYFSLFIYLLV